MSGSNLFFIEKTGVLNIVHFYDITGAVVVAFECTIKPVLKGHLFCHVIDTFI
jgi:hypothetical protein